MSEADAYVVLNLLPGIGPQRVARLIEAFGSPSGALGQAEAALCRVDGIGREVAAAVAGWRKHGDAEGERARAAAHGARIVTPVDGEYPGNLREIYDPPLALYVRGKLEARDRHAIALVGSRTTSYYGRETAKKLGYQAAYAGMTVVSGLARGIDTAAHEGALAAKGRTIGVLGCGIDQVYPPENEALAKRIVESGGAVISEFPVGTQPDRQTFPIRNRVVAGLSMGVVVVESAVNGGALITARMALDQGRQVFAVPGRIDTASSRGCNRLIKEGAALVESAEDILGAFEFLIPAGRVAPKAAPERPANLAPEEARVYEALGEEERHIDEVIRETGLAAGSVFAALMKLELRKVVRTLPGRYFVRVR